MMISPMTSRVVLTYGTFDLFHQGHVKLLRQISSLGSELIVGCATDAHARRIGLPATTPYAQRRLMLESCRYVDRVIAEQDVDQKYTDIVNYNVSVLAMGSDWAGAFDHLEDIARVVYVPASDIVGAPRPFHDVAYNAARVALGR